LLLLCCFLLSISCTPRIMNLFLNIVFIFGRFAQERVACRVRRVHWAAGAAPTATGAATEERACVDRRITKSKRALRTALIDLMEERGFDAVSVNDLCARADLNRGTFYNHFRDKEDLLAALEDEVMADLGRIQEQMA